MAAFRMTNPLPQLDPFRLTQLTICFVLSYGQLNWNWHGWLDGTSAIAIAQTCLNLGVGREPVTYYRPHELPDWFHIGGKPNPDDNLLIG